MSDIALRVEGLSKQFRIGKQERYKSFRDTVTEMTTAPFRRAAGLLRGNPAAAANLHETIWALKDVSFEVKHGEVVGIIGRNGAGKSTLLKVLSRITEPTTGYADVYGRIGALLEVGTGFHPELTGRENIYLNGAILGMSREEINRKFDEIVDFAGVETFIDTPVKHYSSGMGLRLGFAVAAHLEPEILIVDEVLAVGDAEFQKKSMGKMSEVAGEGRTVLFVSHNMAAVENLCSRAILLSEGHLDIDSTVSSVIPLYLARNLPSGVINLADRDDRSGSGVIRFRQIRVIGDSSAGTVSPGGKVSFRIDFDIFDGKPLRNVNAALHFKDDLGRVLFTASTTFFADVWTMHPDDSLICEVRELSLAPGVYDIMAWAAIGHAKADLVEHAATLVVSDGDYYSSGRMPTVRLHGHTLMHHSWSMQEKNAN